MSEGGVLLTEELAFDLADLVAEWKAGKLSPKPERSHRDTASRPPMRGILLEDLVSEGKADCAVTQLFLTSQIQEIEQLGQVSAGTFTLGFQPPTPPKGAAPAIQTTPSLAWNASAAQIQTALENLPAIGKKNVLVTLGNGPYTNALTDTSKTDNPGLWLVSFVGKFETATSIPLLTVTATLSGGSGPAISISEATFWGDTGRVESVRAGIPVGTPTPMRAGAVVLCHFVPSAGYVVGSCEPRQFGPPY